MTFGLKKMRFYFGDPIVCIGILTYHKYIEKTRYLFTYLGTYSIRTLGDQNIVTHLLI